MVSWPSWAGWQLLPPSGPSHSRISVITGFGAQQSWSMIWKIVFSGAPGAMSARLSREAAAWQGRVSGPEVGACFCEGHRADPEAGSAQLVELPDLQSGGQEFVSLSRHRISRQLLSAIESGAPGAPLMFGSLLLKTVDGLCPGGGPGGQHRRIERRAAAVVVKEARRAERKIQADQEDIFIGGSGSGVAAMDSV